MLSAALARHLTTLGLVTFDADTGVDCFLEDLPLDPVAAVGIYSQSGSQPRNRERIRRPGLQIIVRGDDTGGRARSGFERAHAIMVALDDTAHVTWADGTPDAARVAWCLALQSAPVDLGTDENGRPRWSVRFDVELASEVA